MSTRAQVKIVAPCFGDNPVYLYQHFDGDALGAIVRNAIARGKGSYPEYLVRVIFCEMMKEAMYPDSEGGIHDALNDTMSYGIGNSQHGDIDYLVTVDCKAKMVREERRIRVDGGWIQIKEVSFSECKDKEPVWEDD